MDSKLTLTRKQAAEHCNISLPTLDQWLHRRDYPLPCIRAGRKIVIPTDGLQSWLMEEAQRQNGTTI